MTKTLTILAFLAVIPAGAAGGWAEHQAGHGWAGRGRAWDDCCLVGREAGYSGNLSGCICSSSPR